MACGSSCSKGIARFKWRCAWVNAPTRWKYSARLKCTPLMSPVKPCNSDNKYQISGVSGRCLMRVNALTCFEAIANHFWINIQALLKLFWSNYEATVKQRCSNFETTSKQLWSICWRTLKQYWSNFEALLKQFWSTFEIILNKKWYLRVDPKQSFHATRQSRYLGLGT